MANLQATVVAGTLNSLRTENVKTANHTLELVDRDKVVACNNTTDITITIPTDVAVAFPIGSVVYIARLNSGNVTLAAQGGVTVTRTGTMASNEELYVRKRAANTWITVDQPQGLSGTGGTLSSAGGYNIHTFNSSGNFSLS